MVLALAQPATPNDDAPSMGHDVCAGCGARATLHTTWEAPTLPPVESGCCDAVECRARLLDVAQTYGRLVAGSMVVTVRVGG